jgi:recombination protein RecA
MSLNHTNMTDAANKKKALDLALSTIEKQFGKGAIMRLDSAEAAEKIPAISTGSLGIDLALGVGGIPQGRIIEIYGPESSGKTTLTLHIASECQKAGGTVAFIDAEHALDTVYAAKLGVDIPNTLISQPDSGEQALEIADMLVRSGAVNLLIVDSVAALTPKAELEGDMGDSHMGLQARLMSQALRKLTGSIARSNCTVIFINQLRMKIGVMFGNPETTTGGNALKFYASVRMDIRRTGALKDGEEVIGNRTKVKIVKNKVAPPFREVEFDIMYGAGISKEGDLLDVAANEGIIEKAGAWYSYNNQKIGQGRDASKEFLKTNPELMAEIRMKVLAKNGVAKADTTNVDMKTGEIKEEKTPAKKPLKQ